MPKPNRPRPSGRYTPPKKVRMEEGSHPLQKVEPAVRRWNPVIGATALVWACVSFLQALREGSHGYDVSSLHSRLVHLALLIGVVAVWQMNKYIVAGCREAGEHEYAAKRMKWRWFFYFVMSYELIVVVHP